MLTIIGLIKTDFLPQNPIFQLSSIPAFHSIGARQD